MPETPEAQSTNTHIIGIDGEWLMADFSEFFHYYAQVYSLCLVLQPQGEKSDRFAEALARYPWRGGYSVVNFYYELDRVIGRPGRPRVKSIQYASPGAIEIAAVVGAAASVRHIVREFVKSGEMLNSLYNQIRRGMIERKMLSLDVRERRLRLTQEETLFARESYIELSKALRLEGSTKLLEAAPEPITALKVLLSLFRRLRSLATFEIQGRAKL